MSTVADIKRFMLQVLRARGLPIPEDELTRIMNEGFTPKPLLSDVNDARRELERGGFIQGAADELDPDKTTWGLTTKGLHKAKQL